MTGAVDPSSFDDASSSADDHMSWPVLTSRVDRLTLEITKICDIGCSFCKYHVRSSRAGRTANLTLAPDAVTECLAFIRESDVRSVIVTGGGEPTYEMDLVSRIVSSAGCNQIALYTAGQWGSSEPTAHNLVGALVGALNARDADATLLVRFSVDDFHERRLGTLPVARALRAVDAADDPRLSLMIRTVLGHDAAVQRLARDLGADVAVVGDDRSELVLPSGRTVPVLALNLIGSGRIGPARRQRGLAFQPADVTRQRSSKNFGAGWPLLFGGGLNVGVRPSGKVYLYGGTTQDLGRVPKSRLADVVELLARDPINRFVAAAGPEPILSLLASVEPAWFASLGDLSDPSMVIPTLLEDPARRGFVTDVLKGESGRRRASGRLQPTSVLLGQYLQYRNGTR